MSADAIPPAPADPLACEAEGCTRTRRLERVVPAGGPVRVLCPLHRKYALGVSS